MEMSVENPLPNAQSTKKIKSEEIYIRKYEIHKYLFSICNPVKSEDIRTTNDEVMFENVFGTFWRIFLNKIEGKR